MLQLIARHITVARDNDLNRYRHDGLSASHRPVTVMGVIMGLVLVASMRRLGDRRRNALGMRRRGRRSQWRKGHGSGEQNPQ